MGKSPIKRGKAPLPNAQPNYRFSHVATAGELKAGRQSKFTDEEDKEGHRRVILKVILLGWCCYAVMTEMKRRKKRRKTKSLKSCFS